HLAACLPRPRPPAFHQPMIKWLARYVAGFLCMVLAAAFFHAAAAQTPDILLIVPDHCRGDCLSVLGHPAVRGPNLDRLAGDGGFRNLVDNLGIPNQGWAARPWPRAEELHPPVWLGREARKPLKEPPAEPPLFLPASFFAPHPPLFPPKNLFDSYSQQKLPQ